jgi:hypothetical protein
VRKFAVAAEAQLVRVRSFPLAAFADFHLISLLCTRLSYGDLLAGALRTLSSRAFSALPLASASDPCFGARELEVSINTAFMFREACTTVRGLALCGLERHCGRFAAVRAFDLKHFSWGHASSPRFALHSAPAAVVLLH